MFSVSAQRLHRRVRYPFSTAQCLNGKKRSLLHTHLEGAPYEQFVSKELNEFMHTEQGRMICANNV